MCGERFHVMNEKGEYVCTQTVSDEERVTYLSRGRVMIPVANAHMYSSALQHVVQAQRDNHA